MQDNKQRTILEYLQSTLLSTHGEAFLQTGPRGAKVLKQSYVVTHNALVL